MSTTHSTTKRLSPRGLRRRALIVRLASWQKLGAHLVGDCLDAAGPVAVDDEPVGVANNVGVALARPGAARLPCPVFAVGEELYARCWVVRFPVADASPGDIGVRFGVDALVVNARQASFDGLVLDLLYGCARVAARAGGEGRGSAARAASLVMRFRLERRSRQRVTVR